MYSGHCVRQPCPYLQFKPQVAKQFYIILSLKQPPLSDCIPVTVMLLSSSHGSNNIVCSVTFVVVLQNSPGRRHSPPQQRAAVIRRIKVRQTVSLLFKVDCSPMFFSCFRNHRSSYKGNLRYIANCLLIVDVW